MALTEPQARLSVRAVAARAGVSTGSLRHHFPTQRALLDAVVEGLHDAVIPDGLIHDRSIPARDRLVQCLRQVVGPGEDTEALRQAWLNVFRIYVEQTPDEPRRQYFLHLMAQARGRLEGWLTVLVEEGALPPGDVTARAQFLAAVANGLSSARILPTDDTSREVETAVLQRAVDALLQERP